MGGCLNKEGGHRFPALLPPTFNLTKMLKWMYNKANGIQ